MANLPGLIVTAGPILRRRDQQRLYGRCEAIARFLFGIWQLYAVAPGASVTILGFTLFELVFGIAESLPISKPSATRGHEPRSP
ncbi:MAG: hypothetical protein WCV99_15610 [Sterolibacterium sp.]|jgi:hypothetical protein